MARTKKPGLLANLSDDRILDWYDNATERLLDKTAEEIENLYGPVAKAYCENVFTYSALLKGAIDNLIVEIS